MRWFPHEEIVGPSPEWYRELAETRRERRRRKPRRSQQARQEAREARRRKLAFFR
jgi:hypothetical protein